jgi:hypothetical protein
MGTVLAGLMALWLIGAVLGFVVFGMLWLALLCIALLTATAAYGFATGIFNRPSAD